MDTICSICQFGLEDRDEWVRVGLGHRSVCLNIMLFVQAQLPCGHLFHGSCIDESPTVLEACPLCRRSFDSEKLSRFERLLPDVEFPGDAEFHMVTIPVIVTM